MRTPVKIKKHFLFDLDGTLVDSSRFHRLAFVEVLGKSAPEHLREFDYEAIKGRATREVFADFGFQDEGQIAVLTAEKQNAYATAISKNGLPLIAGARALLDFLASVDRNLYVVSAGSRASVEHALRAAGIRKYFLGVTTSNDVKKSKPDPEIYRRCLEDHHLAAKDCVAIEDSDSGIAASIAAGIDSVMVNTIADAPDSCEAFATLEEFCLQLIRAFGANPS
jgi:beta-phosphoglucomutase